eukprot:g3924.t1
MMRSYQLLFFVLVVDRLLGNGESSNGTFSSSQMFLDTPANAVGFSVQRVASIAPGGMVTNFLYANLYAPVDAHALNRLGKKYFENNLMLVCPETKDFPSHAILDSRPRFYADRGENRYNYMPLKLPKYLIPATDSTNPAHVKGDSEIVSFLRRHAETKQHANEANHAHFIILLEAQERFLSAGSFAEHLHTNKGGNVFVHTSFITKRRLHTCQVSLKPKQTTKATGGAGMTDKASFPASTALPLKEIETVRENGKGSRKLGLSTYQLQNITTSRMDIREQTLELFEHGVNEEAETDETYDSSAPHIKERCTFDHSTLLETDNSEADGIMSVLGVPMLADVIKGKLLGFIPNFVEVTGGSIGDASVDSLANSAAPQMDMQQTKSIGGELVRMLTPHLSETLVPPLLETITDSTSESAVELIQIFMTKTLSPRLARAMTVAINEAVVTETPDKIIDHVPLHTARLLTKSLTHILSRSLTHAIVPSLLHTVSHNPLQDFYCYYCYKHKTYCQYCNYGPSQVYYALYYAGFYTNYYSDYYSTAMLKHMGTSE